MAQETADNKGGRRRSPRFDPESDAPFKVSRTKVDLFIRCPRCFYLNQRLGIKTPSGPPFGLNIRIDALMKEEARHFRRNQILNPRAQKIGIKAIPFLHPDIEGWLDVFSGEGLKHLHKDTNLIIFGAPDDIWLVDDSALSIVDVKATHSSKSIEESYFWEENKRQVELYSWLLAKQGLEYPVSEVSYFIRFNTRKEQNNFETNRLEFEDRVIPYVGTHTWIKSTLVDLKACLMQENPPEPTKGCGYCKYAADILKFEKSYKKDR